MHSRSERLRTWASLTAIGIAEKGDFEIRLGAEQSQLSLMVMSNSCDRPLSAKSGRSEMTAFGRKWWLKRDYF